MSPEEREAKRAEYKAKAESRIAAFKALTPEEKEAKVATFKAKVAAFKALSPQEKKAKINSRLERFRSRFATKKVEEPAELEELLLNES